MVPDDFHPAPGLLLPHCIQSVPIVPSHLMICNTEYYPEWLASYGKPFFLFVAVVGAVLICTFRSSCCYSGY